MTSKQEYIKTHGLSAWEELRKKRNPTLKDLIEQFGEELGTQKHQERNKKRAFTLANQVLKYGKEEGTKRYNETREKYKNKGTLDWYIEKYGEVEGSIRYQEKNSKLSVGVKTLISNGYSLEEITSIKEKHRNRSKNTLDNYVERYGEDEGYKKFAEWRNTARLRSKRCVEHWLAKGYDFIEATEKVSVFQSKCTLPWYIEKYGEAEGTVKYTEIVSKKTSEWAKSKGPVSMLETRFFDTLSSQIILDYRGRTSRLVIKGQIYYCDYLDPTSNRIIEIYGDYWHMNPIYYQPDNYNKSIKKFASAIWEADTKRISSLKEAGYQTLIIWESDIVKNLYGSLEKAKQFLKESNENQDN